jgi:hypothetical protein
LSGDFVGVLRDPLVPLDFGGWLRRVYRVFRDNFAGLAGLAVAPLAVVAIYLAVISVVMPDAAEIQQRLAEAAAGSPGGRIGLFTQFDILFGRTLPVFVVFVIIFAVVGSLYQGCAHYVVLRKANGQPAGFSDGLRLAKPRVLPLIGHTILAGLLVIVGLVVPMALGSLLPGQLARIGPITAVIVILGLSVVFWATLNGVVVIERAGVSRCFRLIAQRFWPTLARVLTAWLIYLGYLLVIPLILWLAAPPVGPLSGGAAVLAYAAILVLSIPMTVYVTAVSIVTYAELRFREDHKATTRTLLTELTLGTA